MKTLNTVIDAAPTYLKLMSAVNSVGPDEKIIEQKVYEYKQNQIMMIVQRYHNSLSLMVQMMFDKDNTKKFTYSRRAVQFSPEDDLEELRNFGHSMTEKHIEYTNQQKMVKGLNDQTQDPNPN